MGQPDRNSWDRARQRAGIVLDSRFIDVRWVAADAEQTISVVSPHLPAATFSFGLSTAEALIGAAAVQLRAGARSLRRSTWGTEADWDGATYHLRQRGARLAELQRDADTIAVLARPRRAARAINWAESSITPAEAALGHALAAYAEIGSPGAIANLLRNLS